MFGCWEKPRLVTAPGHGRLRLCPARRGRWASGAPPARHSGMCLRGAGPASFLRGSPAETAGQGTAASSPGPMPPGMPRSARTNGATAAPPPVTNPGELRTVAVLVSPGQGGWAGPPRPAPRPAARGLGLLGCLVRGGAWVVCLFIYLFPSSFCYFFRDTSRFKSLSLCKQQRR